MGEIPHSIQDVIDGFSPNGVYDQIMVYWEDDDGTTNIPTMGWGLSMGRDPVGPPYGASPLPIMIWVRSGRRKWLHCACWFDEAQGYPMPSQGPDSGGALGYTNNGGGMVGWGAWYSDLMQGKVLENGQICRHHQGSLAFGIPSDADGIAARSAHLVHGVGEG